VACNKHTAYTVMYEMISRHSTESTNLWTRTDCNSSHCVLLQQSVSLWQSLTTFWKQNKNMWGQSLSLLLGLVLTRHWVHFVSVERALW